MNANSVITILGCLQKNGVSAVLSGHWAIWGYNQLKPTDETVFWLQANPPGSPLDVSCPVEHLQTAARVLEELGYSPAQTLAVYQDALGSVVVLHGFRVAKDSGRIYDRLGLKGEDLYYAPQTIAEGIVEGVYLRTEGPVGPDDVRPSTREDTAA